MVIAGHVVRCANPLLQIPQADPAGLPASNPARGCRRTHGCEAPHGRRPLCSYEHPHDRSAMEMGTSTHPVRLRRPSEVASCIPCCSIRCAMRSAVSRRFRRVDAAPCISFKRPTKLSYSDNFAPWAAPPKKGSACPRQRVRRIALTHWVTVADNHARRVVHHGVPRWPWRSE